ncbi:T9SS type A sorting domain-containing protein [Chryseobacterium herbae]|uniref:T9SS type A sorting domain-containing protein n=1 Tax=Chryseobacterium herbae TaxID=2976476 RepID=A0ABT2ISX2_9FLAO|nr:T9SS type A sorting domain-containing protein [Chryseobacterium sp. pc1-10]MCT2561921.1 T9SS type A sorting domain-containing protein [Chryseobacterium sp. pc1-10]
MVKVDYNMNFLHTDSSVLTPELRLFPNPVTDILYMTGMKDDQFVIYNAAGQEVKAGSYTAGKGIQVQDVSKGSYWLKLERSKAVQFIKK